MYTTGLYMECIMLSGTIKMAQPHLKLNNLALIYTISMDSSLRPCSKMEGATTPRWSSKKISK